MCAKSIQQPEMPDYFYLRPRSRNWQVRLMAPQKIQPLLDKREYRQSTGTSDRQKARVIGAQLIADKLQEWEALAATLNLDDSTAATTHLSAQLIERICESRLASWLKSDEEERFEDGGLTSEEFDELSRFCELTDAAMRSTLARGPAGPHWNHALDSVFDWCLTLGYDVSPQDPLLTPLVRGFAAAEKLAMSKLSARNSGEDVATPSEPDEFVLAKTNPSRSMASVSLMTPLYEEHKSKTVGWQTVSKNVSIWQRLIEFTDDAPLDSLKSNHIYYFLEARLNAAQDPWSVGYTHGPACRALDEIFSLARTLGHMTAPNPVREMETKPTIRKEENAKRKNPRYPFTTQQINQIYQSNWYDPRATQWTGKMAKDLAGRYWPPLIDQLHGLRGVEALQLVANDFDFSGPVPLVTFKLELTIGKDTDGDEVVDRASMPARSLKNGHTRRTLPIHPKLVELGLVEYVKGRKSLGGITPLFESALPDPGGKRPQWGRAYSQCFLPFVRDTLGFGKGYGNHSWRHKFEDVIRAANVHHGTWPTGVPQLISGRKIPRNADSGVFLAVGSEDDYGDGYDPASLQKYMAQLRFDEIEFPPPFKAWLAGARWRKGVIIGAHEKRSYQPQPSSN
jgi:integrase